MCGIFGYVGNKNAYSMIHKGLKRLEYRGYDSWGIATLSKSKIKLTKNVGEIVNIIPQTQTSNSNIGIGHTRWATHGGVTKTNAHPHFSSDKSFVLAQNGIVQNYAQLKVSLIKKGYKFKTQTDTEVIVRLIEQEQTKTKDFEKAVANAFKKLKGRNTIIILNAKDQSIVAVRNGSPLVIGFGKDENEVLFSSDTFSFVPWVKKITVINNNYLVSYKNGKLELIDIQKGKDIKIKKEPLNVTNTKADKEGFDHFMIKEIHETPYAIRQLLNQDQKEYDLFVKSLKKAKSIYALGSGTSGVAAKQIAYYLRKYAKLSATGLVGAEATEYFDLFDKNTLIIAPSQSGETADVLEVLEIAKKKGARIATFVNMQGSTMTRMSNFKFMIQAGPEICVMATKVLVSKFAWGYLIAKIVQGKKAEGIKNLELTADTIEKFLKNKSTHQQIKSLAKKLCKYEDIFLLSKGQNLQIVIEGMIKMIEGTYIHAHALPAGDLKHYAITLIEKGVPVIGVISEDENTDDVINALNEVKARGATVIAVSPKRYNKFDYFLKMPHLEETSAIINIIPFQLLAYYMAVLLDNNVDKPRNIAKSVTVK